MPSSSLNLRPKSSPNYLRTFRNIPNNLQQKQELVDDDDEDTTQRQRQHRNSNHLRVPGGSGDKKPRPKSVHELPVTTWGGGRPKTPFQRCQRVEQATDPHKGLQTHLPVRKSSANATSSRSQQQYVTSEVIDMGIGFTMSRNKERIAMKITDEIRDPPKKEVIRSFDKEKDELIKRLQQQIADLTMYLEEERLNHKLTKQMAAEDLSRRLESLKDEHVETIRDMKEEHTDEMEEIRTMQKFEMSDLKMEYEKKLDELKKEMEFLQGSFESYKSSVKSDFDEKMFAKENELYNQYEQEKDTALESLRNQLNQEHTTALEALNKDHMNELQAMQHDNQREIDAMMERFSNASNDLNNLKNAQEELTCLQKQNEEQKQEIELLNRDIKSKNRYLEDAKVKIGEYELLLTSKIEAVDESYRQKVYSLMTENSELRKRYISKCEELFVYKVDSDISLQQKAVDAKLAMQVVVEARNRAGINMTCSDVSVERLPRRPYRRPLSAPATRSEESSAKQCAGEITPLTPPTDKRAAFKKRPRSSYSKLNVYEPA